MKLRAKFKFTTVTTTTHHPDYPGFVTARFDAQYDQSIPEDQRFCKATPSGHFEMTTTPEVVALLVPGTDYYFDISPVAAPAE